MNVTTTNTLNTPAFPFAETPLLEAILIREVRVSYLATARVRFEVKEPHDVAAFVRSVLHDNSREYVIALYLDGGHRVGAYSLISIGFANLAPVHPREIYQRAIAVGAISLVLAHNHPSRQLEPRRLGTDPPTGRGGPTAKDSVARSCHRKQRRPDFFERTGFDVGRPAPWPRCARPLTPRAGGLQ